MLVRYIVITSVVLFLSVVTYFMVVSMTFDEEKAVLVAVVITLLLMGIPGVLVSRRAKRKSLT